MDKGKRLKVRLLIFHLDHFASNGSCSSITTITALNQSCLSTAELANINQYTAWNPFPGRDRTLARRRSTALSPSANLRPPAPTQLVWSWLGLREMVSVESTASSRSLVPMQVYATNSTRKNPVDFWRAKRCFPGLIAFDFIAVNPDEFIMCKLNMSFG